MSREIKFRAFDKRLSKMIFDGMPFHLFGEVLLIGGLMEHFFENPIEGVDSLERLNDLEVMQFTGLVDKSGKEICEGDILYSSKIQMDEPPPDDKWTVAVVFEDGAFCYGHHGDPLDSLECKTEMEIVGNVFQNPEIKVED